MRQRRTGAVLHWANADLRARFLAFFFVLLATALATHAARSAPAAGIVVQPATVAASGGLRPADMKAGTLLVKVPHRARFHEAPLLGTDVDITVSGVIARVTVSQRFQNSNHSRADGLYVFPLPDGAAVDGLRMEIGERMVQGRIASRSEVRRLFEHTLANGPRARLVADALPNMFASAVTDIAPGQTIGVRLEYQYSLRADDGTFSLRVPLNTTPAPQMESLIHAVRFGPDVLDTRAREDRDAGKRGPVSLQLHLDAGAPLGEIASLNHKVSIKRTGTRSALLALTDDDAMPADRDFVLTWSLEPGSEPRASLFVEPAGESDHVMVMITPPTPANVAPKPAREIVFVIDASGSMSGAAIAQSKASLLVALQRLGSQDRFNIIRFNSTVESLFASAKAASPGTIAEARAFIARLEARGGTEMLPALSLALRDKRPKERSRIRQIVFLTDGAVTGGPELFREIAKARGRSRLFTVGIGAAPNAEFMRRAAEIGRGSYLHIDSETRVLAELSALLIKLERPAVTNLKASWNAGAATEIWPDPLPDIYAGEPLVISARLVSAIGDLTLHGEISGRPWKTVLKLADARPGPGVARSWAKRKIASLEARRFAGQSRASIDDAIQTVALRHRLPSRMTGLIAVERTRSDAGGKPAASVETPVNRPVDWTDDDEWAADTIERAPFPPRATRSALRDTGHAVGRPAVRLSGPAAEAAPRTDGRQLAYYDIENRDVLSQPMLKTNRSAWLALMALFFVAMSAMTLGFWRHLRREYASLRRYGRRI